MLYIFVAFHCFSHVILLDLFKLSKKLNSRDSKYSVSFSLTASFEFKFFDYNVFAGIHQTTKQYLDLTFITCAESLLAKLVKTLIEILLYTVKYNFST